MSGLSEVRRALRVYVKTAWWGLIAPRTHERAPLVVVQAVILRSVPGPPDRREILLSVRSDVKGFELPGGTPEAGEAHETTLAREVLEETGLDVRVERHVGDYVRTGFRPHRARVYICSVEGGVLRPSRETPEVDWFALDQLPPALFPWYRGPIADALADAETAVERHEHQGVAAIWAGLRIDLATRLRGGRARRS